MTDLDSFCVMLDKTDITYEEKVVGGSTFIITHNVYGAGVEARFDADGNLENISGEE